MPSRLVSARRVRTAHQRYLNVVWRTVSCLPARDLLKYLQAGQKLHTPDKPDKPVFRDCLMQHAIARRAKNRFLTGGNRLIRFASGASSFTLHCQGFDPGFRPTKGA